MSQSDFPIKKEVTVKKEDGSTPTSPSKQQEWQTIPLKSCTEEDVKDIRFHIMKFATKQDVNITKDFTRPVRLHRKDPRNMQFHLTREELDQRKREKQQMEKLKQEEKEATAKPTEESEEKEEKDKPTADAAKVAPEKPTLNKNQADMSQVAPDGGARKNRKNLFKRKTRQINLMNEEKRKLRYEEHYPWVIEDYDGKNVFVGNYEAGSTEQQHVLFVFDKDGFKMIPAEKVYRFTPRNRYATLTLEEAEAKMERNSSVPRWLMKHMEDRSISEGTPDQRFRYNSPAANGSVIANVGNGSAGRRMRTVLGGSGSGNDRDSDHDDLDYDEEFADDEEAPIMDGDEEENKLSEKKIKKEMLKAAHFDGQLEAEAEDDLDDLFETEKTRKVDKEGKKLRKVLNKREGGVYDSDEEDGLMPYLSKSDLESDEESDDEVQVKKESSSDSQTDNNTNKTSRAREVSVKSIGDGFVVIKAPPSFLGTMPPGDWNPQARKRPTPEIVSPRKKIKLDETIKVKKERTLSPPPVSPTTNAATNTSSPGNGMDLNDAGPDNLLVTVKDVLDIVKDQPLTTKELLMGLKSRVSAHKDNKLRIISIVKQNLRLVDGKLVLKD